MATKVEERWVSPDKKDTNYGVAVVGKVSSLLDVYFGAGMDIRAEVRDSLIKDYEVEPESADIVIGRWIELGNSFGDYRHGEADAIADEIYRDTRVWD